MPEFSYELSSDKMVFGASADSASDVGHYEYKSGAGGTQVADRGKSIVNWVKRDGQWKIPAHAYSSDAPFFPPTPTVPADAVAPTPGTAPGLTPTTPGPTAPTTEGAASATPAPTAPTTPVPSGSSTTPPAPPPPSPQDALAARADNSRIHSSQLLAKVASGCVRGD